MRGSLNSRLVAIIRAHPRSSALIRETDSTYKEKVMQEVSTESSRTVVANFFRALRAGDMDALRAAIAPDATWILRGGLPASGTWTGPDGILDGFFPRIFGRLDPEVPVVQDVHRIIADGEYAVAEWTTHARTRDGRRYDSDYAAVFRVVNGQLAAVTEYLDTAYAQRVLFAS
jgi:ketosteroid isomerase-like protein